MSNKTLPIEENKVFLPKNMYFVKLFRKKVAMSASVSEVGGLETTETFIYENEIISTLSPVLRANGLFSPNEVITLAQIKAAWELVLNNPQGLLLRMNVNGSHQQKMEQVAILRNSFVDVKYGRFFISYDSILWNEPMDSEEATDVMKGNVKSAVPQVEIDAAKKVKLPTKRTKTV